MCSCFNYIDKFRKKGFNFRKFEMEMMLKAKEM
jgi:hypothetical protein